MEAYRDYGNKNKAKILVIGHDKKLELYNDVNKYNLYNNFKLVVDSNEEGAKLVKSVYEYIHEITNNKYTDEEIYLTNLCNDELQHAPKNKAKYIKAEKEEEAIKRIKSILENSNVEYIFVMSLEANYWLQNLNFYSSNNEKMETSIIGKTEEFNKEQSFKNICGNVYIVNNSNIKIIPILQVKQYMLNTSIKKHYDKNYKNLKGYFNNN